MSGDILVTGHRTEPAGRHGVGLFRIVPLRASMAKAVRTPAPGRP
jgi:hypothetical protein